MFASNILQLLAAVSLIGQAVGCSDFYMNFTSHKLSGRTMDLGAMSNWTLTSWPTNSDEKSGNPPLAFWTPKIGVVGVTANWFGDDHYGFPSLFADSLNEQGLSCSLLALNTAQYEEKSDTKTNVFAGLFCFYVAQNYGNVYDLKDALPGIAIWGPDALAQHFIVHDASGASLIVEVVEGRQTVYLDTNTGVNGKFLRYTPFVAVFPRLYRIYSPVYTLSLTSQRRPSGRLHERAHFRLAPKEHRALRVEAHAGQTGDRRARQLLP
jgi:penicillin V acylase-like amidase (Ntn superfamily)